jgi:hypothetical protein
MPKPNVIISAYQKKELFIKICVKSGFPIRTKQDCRKVSELIKNEGYSALSESTIYRLFLLKENTNQPYLHTLNVLAKYCGFKDWQDFETVQNSVDQFVYGFGKFKDAATPIKSLIAVCIHTNELKPLIHYTEQFETISDVDINYKFAEEIFQSVLTNQNNETFFKEFAHFRVIREFFFEILADPSFSIPGYESGIHHYLKGLNPHGSVQELQDFIFGNCLLFRHYFLTKSTEKAKELGNQLFRELTFTTEELASIHVFPAARYYACKLMYLEMNEQLIQTESFFEWLMAYFSARMDQFSLDEKKILFYCLGEALIFNSYLVTSHQDQLKALFTELFDLVPNRLMTASLEQIVPYFNKNSSIYHFNPTT